MIEKIDKNLPPLLMKMNLSFFAKDGPGGEKTEDATPKKRKQARDEGQVALSPEIATAFTYIIVFSALTMLAPFMYSNLQALFFNAFLMAETSVPNMMDTRYAGSFVGGMLVRGVLLALPLMLIAMLVGFLSGYAQVGWNPSSKKMKLKFNKLNPISGLKRMFSFQSIMNFIKSLLKMIIIGLVIYTVLSGEISELPGLLNLTVMESVRHIGNLIVRLGMTVGIWFIAVAAIDYAYQRYKNEKEMRMTKYEIKQEYKQTEGDPHIKGKIRQKMQEASMRRMMQAVPEADVVITNPTHFAVAVKYDREGGSAPIVTAKGADFLAKKIKEKAIENNVQVVENKQLARALYATVDVGREIPPELYQAVAEILAYIYKFKNAV
ncbi:MAG: flagellar biosynthesis protein FlhB [Defluviitaleaceae bacterium]|nr:flagellar biosynthesis protein FlhB [Defluviitaleaceae bacterium]